MRKHRVSTRVLLSAAAIALAPLSACEGPAGPAGRAGVVGSDGAPGQDGINGTDGVDGAPGKDGADGANGMDGANGVDGAQGPEGPQGPQGVPPAPLAATLTDYVKARVAQYAAGALPKDAQFPLKNAATDTLRTLEGARAQVIVRWLEPLTFSSSIDAPRFGANTDYLAYFGDGWDMDPADPPQWHGSGDSAWLWANQEYMSGLSPTLSSAPTGQQLVFARFLRDNGVLTNAVESNVWAQADINTFVAWSKKQVGGTWLHIVRDPSTGDWSLDRGAKPVRYDSTSSTLFRVTGAAVLSGLDHDDIGAALPSGVIVGTSANCSGAVTPWGTVISAEENTQFSYGDLEACWSSDQKFLLGQGFDPGTNVSPVSAAAASSEFGKTSDPNGQHARDTHGYLAEIDPGVAPDEYEGKTQAGVGHKKLGAFGRARWENTTFAVDSAWKLVPDKPVVAYGGDDRRSGRIYKWVSSANYTAGMTKAQARALLDDGDLYVAHFAGINNTTGNTMLATGDAPTEAAPGAGQWIHLSVNSADVAPNAAALGMPVMTVGGALKDVSYNGIGGFPTDDDVYRTLFTASNKIGIMELNRPEDIEYNPMDWSGSPRLYVAFTNNNKKVALDQAGKLYDPATHAAMSPTRADTTGAIFAIAEEQPNDPAASKQFTFFEVWHGSKGTGDFDAACPDNIVIDHDGGVWFGTDGNFGVNGTADAVYYLDLDPAHAAGQAAVTAPTLGLAFRVAGVPSDAETTGPAFSSDRRTLFLSVQHPGEEVYSSWPDGGTPLSSVVAINFTEK